MCFTKHWSSSDICQSSAHTVAILLKAIENTIAVIHDCLRKALSQFTVSLSFVDNLSFLRAAVPAAITKSVVIHVDSIDRSAGALNIDE